MSNIKTGSFFSLFIVCESKTIAVKHRFSLNQNVVIHFSFEFNFSKVYVKVIYFKTNIDFSTDFNLIFKLSVSLKIKKNVLWNLTIPAKLKFYVYNLVA